MKEDKKRLGAVSKDSIHLMPKVITPKEYNELINLLAIKKSILEEIKYECHGNKEAVPVIRLKKILARADNGI